MEEIVSIGIVACQPIPNLPRKGVAPKPIKAEKLCALPECDVTFAVRSLNAQERFCCAAHKAEYWRLSAQLGDRLLRGEMSVTGKSQKQCVLELLQSYEGRWVTRPLQRLPFVNWNVVSRLRKKGYNIQCRMVFRDDILRREYQYRLLVRSDTRAADELKTCALQEARGVVADLKGESD